MGGSRKRERGRQKNKREKEREAVGQTNRHIEIQAYTLLKNLSTKNNAHRQD